MPILDTISPVASASDIGSSSLPPYVASNDPPNVISNDPITDVRLLASLPANLGQNLDASA